MGNGRIRRYGIRNLDALVWFFVVIFAVVKIAHWRNHIGMDGGRGWVFLFKEFQLFCSKKKKKKFNFGMYAYRCLLVCLALNSRECRRPCLRTCFSITNKLEWIHYQCIRTVNDTRKMCTLAKYVLGSSPEIRLFPLLVEVLLILPLFGKFLSVSLKPSTSHAGENNSEIKISWTAPNILVYLDSYLVSFTSKFLVCFLKTSERERIWNL